MVGGGAQFSQNCDCLFIYFCNVFVSFLILGYVYFSNLKNMYKEYFKCHKGDDAIKPFSRKNFKGIM